MTSLRIGVIRGGPSAEYDVSLNTGKTILEALSAHPAYTPVDIFIDRYGTWHLEGRPVAPAALPSHIDVVFNALHGAYGEDGQVQHVLETIRMPYTGSGVLASAVAMHKGRAKDIFKEANIPIAPSASFNAGEDDESVLRDIFGRIAPPYIVKPLSGGSSVGVRIARGYHELHDAVYENAAYSPEVLIESLVQGREATCGVIDDFRGEPLYALLPVEIVPPESSPFFDYKAKYSGGTQEICPGRFSSDETRLIQEYAKKAHHALGLRDYSRSDFIVTPRRIVILETNSLPGLTSESLLPKSLDAVGAGIHEFLEHLISRAHGRR
jgi:D-alanine-D-alanine ligase